MLYRDSGLSIYQDLDDAMDKKARLQNALKLAQEQYQNASESERGLEPSEAIRQLVRTTVMVSGIVAITSDYEFLRTFPSLEPYVPLSPALNVLDQLVQALGDRITSRCEKTFEQYMRILDRTGQPDRGGLDESYHTHVRNGIKRAIGTMQASMGLSMALDYAMEIEANPVYRVNALQIQMLYYLWQGDIEKAIRFKKEIELLQIQQSPLDLYEGSYLSQELVAYTIVDDLTAVKLIMNSIEKMARKHRAWMPTLYYAQGEFHRIRGDFSNALHKLREALKLTATGRHQNWADIAGAYLKTLVGMGNVDEALEQGEAFLKTARREELGFMEIYIKMPLAVAYAQAGKSELALLHIHTVIDRLIELGSTGINLGLAYEIRAQIALHLKDSTNYKKYCNLCEEQFCNKKNHVLITRYENLVRDYHRPSLGISSSICTARLVANNDPAAIKDRVLADLEKCKDVAERDLYILNLINEYSHTKVGYLYTLDENGLCFVCQTGNCPRPENMDTIVKEYLSAEVDNSREATVTGTNLDLITEPGSQFSGDTSERYQPILLGYPMENGYNIIGVVVLLLESEQSFNFPSAVIEIISKLLHDFGNTTSLITDW